jgi:photosystem II stability/assembly factor-like uncharacterized protein
LKTTDGGKHWTAANLPAGIVFRKITVLDALHAILTDNNGQMSYSTSDGGTTWNPMTKP